VPNEPNFRQAGPRAGGPPAGTIVRNKANWPPDKKRDKWFLGKKLWRIGRAKAGGKTKPIWGWSLKAEVASVKTGKIAVRASDFTLQAHPVLAYF